MSVTDSTCSLKFGPKWIRLLSDSGIGSASGSGAGGGGGSSNGGNLHSQGGGGGGGGGATGSGASGFPNLANSSSGHQGLPPRKYPLAKFRYGKEELIAIYEQSLYGDNSAPVVMPPGDGSAGNSAFVDVWMERSQTPRSLQPMSEDEQRLWACYRLPSASTGRGRGRGLGPLNGGGGSSTMSGGWNLAGQGGGAGQQTIMRSWRSPSGPQYSADRGGPIRDRTGSSPQGQSVFNTGTSSGNGGSNSSGLWRRTSQTTNQGQQHQQSIQMQQQQQMTNRDHLNNNNSSNSNNSNSASSHPSQRLNNNGNMNSNDSDDNRVPEWADDSITGSDGADPTEQVGSFDERGGFLGGPPAHVDDRSPSLNSSAPGSIRNAHQANISPNLSRQPQPLQRSLSNIETTESRPYRDMTSVGYSPEVDHFSRKSVAPAASGVGPSERELSTDGPAVSSPGPSHPPTPQHTQPTIDDSKQPVLVAMVARGHCNGPEIPSSNPAAVLGSPVPSAHWAPCSPIIQPQQTPPRVDQMPQMSSSVIGSIGQPAGVCNCTGQHSTVTGCGTSCTRTLLAGTASANPSIAGGSCDLWFYKDPQGVIQGPFPSSDMIEWCGQGYFHDGLECRRACDSAFSALGALKKAWNGHLPFLAPAMMEPITVPLVHNSQQHIHNVFSGALHTGVVTSSAAGGAVGMGGVVGGTSMGGLLSGVPNSAHMLLSSHAHAGHMDGTNSPRNGTPVTSDQQMVTANGIISQQQHVDASIQHHQGPLQLQELFGSVGGPNVVSMGLPRSMLPDLGSHPVGNERLLPGADVTTGGNHSPSMVSSPSRSVAAGSSGKMISLGPVRDAIQRNMVDSHEVNNNERVITPPARNSLSNSCGDVCDLASLTTVGGNDTVTLNGASRPDDLIMSEPRAIAPVSWYDSGVPSSEQTLPPERSPPPPQPIDEDVQLQQLQAANDAVRRKVQEKNERNIATDQPTSEHMVKQQQQSPHLSADVLSPYEQATTTTAAATVRATHETRRDIQSGSATTAAAALVTSPTNNHSAAPATASGGGAGGSKKKKDRREKKATNNDKDKQDASGPVGNGKSTKNRGGGGDEWVQRGGGGTAGASKDSKKSSQQQQQQQQQQHNKEQQESMFSEWSSDCQSEEYDRETNLIVPAPAPAVPAWGARSEWTGDKTAPTPSLGEIQRAEEERAQRERAQRQREAARSGCTTASARTWASAIAPTKSFEQIQKEEASRVVHNHVSSARTSPSSNRTNQPPALMSTAVANGVTSSHPVSKAVTSPPQQPASAKTTPAASTLAAATKIAPPSVPKTPLVPEVTSSEQQLIDWCLQVTLGLNSKTYLDIPTVVSILKDVESEAEIEDYVSQFFGESLKEPRQFARQFVQKRARLGVGAASTQSRQPGWCTTGGGKKNRNSGGSHNNGSNKANSKRI
ncbi:hypothetical protein BIW11_11279 [Tropilaelaps mercedesae]|uniref:GYF domain-containing protein n=1 Tax=Tropilaelaps mercedesae TaxID=418985 RepID=A0A1V9XBQ7_9ACAR|nr:hypothetical protein BIW11_11279 [Tropilaelaps mercedesae]